jgi:folate-binding protein YgfZ
VPKTLRTSLTDRRLIAIGGEDRFDFLNNILTQSVSQDMPVLVAAALLTPQGKLLDEFLLYRRANDILLDCNTVRRESIRTRLQMYKLRSRVTLEDVAGAPVIFWGEQNEAQAHPDPRHGGLGWRSYEAVAPESSAEDWHHHRLSLGIAEGPDELVPGEQFPLEMGLHLTHAIDFQKGCFIGQEVTSRSFRRGSLRKGLFPCRIDGDLTTPAAIRSDNGQVGEVLCQRGALGLALLRFDALDKPLNADGQKITVQSGLFTE